MAEQLTHLALLVCGLALLLGGAQVLVRSCEKLAVRAGISPLVIGIVLVGFGTSMPELVTSIQAALAGVPAIALGNIVGSNIANLLLVLGAAALFAPVGLSRALLPHALGVLAAACVLAGLAYTDALSRWAGAALLIAAVAHLAWIARTESRKSRHLSPESLRMEPGEPAVPAPSKAWPMLVLALCGLGFLIVGGRLIVDAAISLASGFGVSPSVISVTVIAFATSLPEVTAAIMAVRRGRADLALGNIIGSNIYNILGVGGVTLALVPLRAPEHMLVFDIPLMVVVTALFVAGAWAGLEMTRRHGAALLALYCGFLVLVVAV